jgi:hypothetical protein
MVQDVLDLLLHIGNAALHFREAFVNSRHHDIENLQNVIDVFSGSGVTGAHMAYCSIF